MTLRIFHQIPHDVLAVFGRMTWSRDSDLTHERPTRRRFSLPQKEAGISGVSRALEEECGGGGGALTLCE